MANLKNHGSEILRLEYLSSSVSCRSDGYLLRNTGNGWKLFRKVKPGIDPVSYFAGKAERRNARLAACPIYAQYIRKLSEYGVSTRSMIHRTLELIPNDPDGVWSTLEDYGKHADLDDLVELSRLHTPAIKQLREYNEALRAAKSENEVSA